jgi:hypothetical protein
MKTEGRNKRRMKGREVERRKRSKKYEDRSEEEKARLLSFSIRLY